MSPVSFDSIPSNLRIPITLVEFNASKASQGPTLLQLEGLLIGQKTSAGTGTANTVRKVTSADQVATLAGRGSMLHRQAIAWFAENTTSPCWIALLADDGAGVAATGTITVTGPATAAGTIALYIGGNRITVGVGSTDTAITVAAAIAAAINAATDLPVTAAVGGVGSEHIVTVSFRHRGTVGNGYDLRHSYRLGEALPTGIALAIVAMANGTTAPALATLFAAMADQWFHVWTHPYTDSTNLGAIETELTSRNGPMRSIDAIAFTSPAGSVSHGSLTTLGNARNNRHSCVVAQAGENPLTPSFEFAASVAARAALSLQADPARPLHTLQLSHPIAMAETDRFTKEERNNLLYDGIATTVIGAGEVVQLEGMITTWQLNAANSPDTAYLWVTTLATLMYLRFEFRARMQTKYPRHKLADDGTAFGAGQAVITPSDGKAEAIGWFKDMMLLGLVENLEQFVRDLIVERDLSNRNQMNFYLPTDLMNFLGQTAAQIGFRN